MPTDPSISDTLIGNRCTPRRCRTAAVLIRGLGLNTGVLLLLAGSANVWFRVDPTMGTPREVSEESQDGGQREKVPDVSARQWRACLQLILGGEYEKARRLAEELVRSYPGSSNAELLLGRTYHEEHRYELAESHFVRAVEFDPTNYRVRPYYGWCLYNLGKADQARTMFESLLQVKPNHPDPHFALGLLDFDADAFASAEVRFKTAIELAKALPGRRNGRALVGLADVYVRSGRLEEAKVELERAIKLNPDLYDAYFKLSRVLQRLGNDKGAERARAMYEKVRQRVRPSQGHAE